MVQIKQPAKQIQMLMDWIASGGLAIVPAMVVQIIALEALNVMERVYLIMKQNVKTQQDASGAHAGRRAVGITHLKLVVTLILIVIGVIMVIAHK